MIESFAPRRFKCFSDDDFRLRRLTLLTGINGSGKSSLIQAILLARQAAHGEAFVRLNGPANLQLGHAEDVFNLTAEGGDRRIELDFGLVGGERAKWILSAADGGALVLRVDDRPAGDSDFVRNLAGNLVYLCAERNGPRDVSLTDSLSAESIDVGAQGEFVAQVLLLRERERVRTELLHPRTKAAGDVVSLGKQVELWMRDLVPGLDLRVRSFEGTNAVALRMRRAGETVEWLRPTNMAFGVTYASRGWWRSAAGGSGGERSDSSG